MDVGAGGVGGADCGVSTLSRDLSFEARTSTPPPFAGTEGVVVMWGEEEEIVGKEADGAFVLLCFAAISRSVRNTPAEAVVCCAKPFA
jgi:hypothetical protein